MKQTFEDKLLAELKQHITEHEPVGVRSRWTTRTALTIGVAAVLATAVAVVLPTVGGEQSRSTAYAVTEANDGKVTIDILDISDAEGLERKIEEHGIAASVHYLPQDKLCAPPWYHDRMAGRPHKRDLGPEDPVWHQLRGVARLSEPEPGVARLTVDKASIPDGWWLVITAEHDDAEFGPREGQLVPSIAAGFEKGDQDACELVEGSIEGWGFQVGVPLVSDEEKAAKSAERETAEQDL
jgi:hypothetical protein